MESDLDRIKSDIISLPTSRFVSKWFFDRVPFAFSNDKESYTIWRESIASKIMLDPSDILISGSACFGYSLSPYKQFKPFDSKSDVDICIISSYYFDTAWNELLQLKELPPESRMREAINDHRTRLIYWGTIATDKILPLLSFGPKWNRILAESKTNTFLENREINFRIYKDRFSIRRYIGESVNKCKNELLGGAAID